MSVGTTVLLGAVGLAAMALAGCAPEPDPAPAAAPLPFQPVASIQELMLLQVDPNADPLWEAVGTVETRAGIETRVPANEEQWQVLRAHALRLVETGNLLLVPGRHAVPHQGAVPGAHIAGVLDHAEVEGAVRREWPRFSAHARDFQSAALATLQAIDSRNAGDLLVTGERLQETCEQCHGHFWYPGDKPPADPAASDVVPLTN